MGEPADQPVLAFGADVDASVCAAAGGRAQLSVLDMDLNGPGAVASLREEGARLASSLTSPPGGADLLIAHDGDAGLRSSGCALERAGRHLAVQHHHAHLAAVLAEHGERGPVVGAILDGPGLGPDGTVWGGELLIGDAATCERAGLLFPVRLPGGDVAHQEPWRMACAWLAAGADGVVPSIPSRLAGTISGVSWEAASEQARLGVGSPLTTCAMRLLDAAAALCGITAPIGRDGDAARLLSAAAVPRPERAYELPLVAEGQAPILIDARPAIAALLADLDAGVAVGEVGGRLREGLAAATAAACAQIAAARGLGVVALGGRCFEDEVLLERTAELVAESGLRVLVPDAIPPGDAAVSLGQALVVSRRPGDS